MKSTLSYSASLLLTGLGLTSALPQGNRGGDVTITFLLGDGDAASTISAGIGRTTAANRGSAHSSLFQDNVWCGGFKDAEATNLWSNFDGTDGIFSTGIDAVYSEACLGGFQCGNGARTVNVASYYCADSLAGVQNRIRQRTLPPNGRLNGNTPPPVNNGGNNGGEQPAAGDVNIQFLLGDQDAASTLRASIGATTAANKRSALSSLFQDNVFCGGFRDAEATDLWLNFDGTDGIFSSGVEARYHENCEDSFCRQGAVTVNVVSYWCGDSVAGVEERIRARTLPPNGRAGAAPPNNNNNNNNGAAPAAPVNNGGNNGGAAPPVGISVNVQVETERQTTFFGETVAVSGRPETIRNSAAISLTLTSATGADLAQVQCVVIGTDGQVISQLSGISPAILSQNNTPVRFQAIQCEI